MIAWLMNQIRMGRCEHDFYWSETDVYNENYQDTLNGKRLPVRRDRTGICCKCGYRVSRSF